MPRDPELDTSGDVHPHERFEKLARKILAVPKAEIDARDKKWQKRPHIKPGPKKRR